MERPAYETMALTQAEHWWYEGRRRILREVIRGLDLPPDPLVLEAGCGTGANLAMLREFGEVNAFEPDESARQNAALSEGVQVRTGALPDAIPFTGPFDLVAVLDVLEHVRDDRAALEALLAVLRPGGYGVFTVPAYQWMWSPHDELNHHFRRYTRPGLRRLLTESGFGPLHVNYFNTWLFPAVASVRAYRRLRRQMSDGDVKMPSSELVNKSLTRIFASERHLVPHVPMPFGVSLLAVTRRSPTPLTPGTPATTDRPARGAPSSPRAPRVG